MWAYEAVPHIGRMFALKPNNVVIPRGLRWHKKTRPGVDNVERALEGKFRVLTILQEEEGEYFGDHCYFSEEEEDPYFDQLVRETEDVRKRKGKEMSNKNSRKEGNQNHTASKGTTTIMTSDICQLMVSLNNKVLKNVRKQHEDDQKELSKMAGKVDKVYRHVIAVNDYDMRV